MKIRDAEPRDIPAILALYNLAVRETTAAWTTKEETLDERLTWFESRKKQGLPVLVAADGADEVIGFASYGAFRAKEGYRLTAEHSVYVDPKSQRKGIGAMLLKRLMEVADAKGIHVLVGVIDGENSASIALHEKYGFELTGRMPEIGVKFGRWLDLILMTKILQSAPAPEQ